MMLVVRSRNQPGRKWLLKVLLRMAGQGLWACCRDFRFNGRHEKLPRTAVVSLGEKHRLWDVDLPFVGPLRRDLSWWSTSLCIPYSLEEKRGTISREWIRQSVNVSRGDHRKMQLWVQAGWHWDLMFNAVMRGVYKVRSLLQKWERQCSGLCLLWVWRAVGNLNNSKGNSD